MAPEGRAPTMVCYVKMESLMGNPCPLPPTDVPLPFYTSREWGEEDGGLGPPGARSGVKLPLRVVQEQTEIFCELCWWRGSCVAKPVPTSPRPGAPYRPCPVVKTLGRRAATSCTPSHSHPGSLTPALHAHCTCAPFLPLTERWGHCSRTVSEIGRAHV